MATQDVTLSVRAARDRYFAENGLGDGGYTARWVKLKAGPLSLAFPNTAARVAAVRFHDIHHILTEYKTTWTGEAEIGTWEIASSCAHHYAAWMLNLQAMAIGLVISPKAVWRAFLRGRQTKNLYHEEFGEALLTPTVSELRHRLQLDKKPQPTILADYVAFAGWSIVSVATFVATTVLLLAPLAVLWSLLFSP